MRIGNRSFHPSLGCFRSIVQVPFATIRRPNVILDVDNTLAEPLYDHLVPDEILAALEAARKSGYIQQICLLSNMVVPHWPRRERRLERIAEMVGAEFVVRAYWPFLKPRIEPFYRAIDLMSVDIRRIGSVVMIGDQLHTDIRGGNAAGVATIKVAPLGQDPFWVAGKRRQEEVFMRAQGLEHV